MSKTETSAVLNPLAEEKTMVSFLMDGVNWKLFQYETKRRGLDESKTANRIIVEYLQALYEDVLGSKVRRKIIFLLSKFGRLHQSAIADKVRGGLTATKKQLKYLESIGILKVYEYGKRPIRMCSLNLENPKTQAFIEFVEKWYEGNAF